MKKSAIVIAGIVVLLGAVVLVGSLRHKGNASLKAEAAPASSERRKHGQRKERDSTKTAGHKKEEMASKVVAKARTPVPSALPAMLQAPPPRDPPASAKTTDLGIRYETLKEGTEAIPPTTQSLGAKLSLYGSDGTLIAESYSRPSGPLHLDQMPAALADTLRSLKIGSLARFWIPEAALTGWQPRSWPKKDVIASVEPTVARERVSGTGNGEPQAKGDDTNRKQRRPGGGGRGRKHGGPQNAARSSSDQESSTQ